MKEFVFLLVCLFHKVSSTTTDDAHRVHFEHSKYDQPCASETVDAYNQAKCSNSCIHCNQREEAHTSFQDIPNVHSLIINSTSEEDSKSTLDNSSLVRNSPDLSKKSCCYECSDRCLNATTIIVLLVALLLLFLACFFILYAMIVFEVLRPFLILLVLLIFTFIFW